MTQTQNSRRRFLRGSALTLAAASTLVLIPTTGCDTNWIAMAQKDIDPIIAIVETIGTVALTASGNGELVPVVMPILAAGVAATKIALTTLKQLIDDYATSKSPTTLGRIDDALTDVQASITDLLTKIPGLPANVSQVVTTGFGIVLSVLASLQLVVPPSAKTLAAKPYRSVAGVSMKVKAEPPTANQVRAGFNAVLVVNGYAEKQI